MAPQPALALGLGFTYNQGAVRAAWGHHLGIIVGGSGGEGVLDLPSEGACVELSVNSGDGRTSWPSEITHPASRRLHIETMANRSRQLRVLYGDSRRPLFLPMREFCPGTQQQVQDCVVQGGTSKCHVVCSAHRHRPWLLVSLLDVSPRPAAPHHTGRAALLLKGCYFPPINCCPRRQTQGLLGLV